MTDFNDPNLINEHALRNHVQTQQQRLDALDTEMGEYNTMWFFTFDTDNGGRWRVQCYRYDADVKGAELSLVVDEVIEQVRRKRGLKVLRTLIEHSPVSDDTSDVLRINQASADLT